MLTSLHELLRYRKIECALRDIGKKVETLAQLLDLEINKLEAKVDGRG